MTAGALADFDTDLLRLELHISFLSLRQYCHGGSRGVDTALRLVAGTPAHGGHRFHASQRAEDIARPLTLEHDFRSPPMPEGIGFQRSVFQPRSFTRLAAVHAEKVTGEDRSLVPPGTGADFHDHAIATLQRILAAE